MTQLQGGGLDPVVGTKLVRQQPMGKRIAHHIRSDIVYGREGKLTDTNDYQRLPLQILVTRPQEKYSMRLTYQTPEAVTIGKTYPATAFVLENSWELEVLDLDKKLQEVVAQQPRAASSPTPTVMTRFQ